MSVIQLYLFEEMPAGIYITCIPISILGTGDEAECGSAKLLRDGQQVVEHQRLEQWLALHELVAQLRRQRRDHCVHLAGSGLRRRLRLRLGLRLKRTLRGRVLLIGGTTVRALRSRHLLFGLHVQCKE